MDKSDYTKCRVNKASEHRGYSLVLETNSYLDMKIIASFAKRENAAYSILKTPSLSFNDKKELEELLKGVEPCKIEDITFKVTKNEGLVFIKEYGKYETLEPVAEAAIKEGWKYESLCRRSLIEKERRILREEMKK